MNILLKNIEEVANAINILIERSQNGNVYVKTKRIRDINGVKSSDRSKINFVWRSLKILEGEGILGANGSITPSSYVVNIAGKIDIDRLISKLKPRLEHKHI